MFISRARTFVQVPAPRYIAAVLILSFIPFGAVHAADDCASTFRMSGSQAEGYVFDARTDGTGVGASDALGMVRKVALDKKLSASDGVVAGEHAEIELRSFETVTTDAMALAVALDRGSASIKATYPPGAPASESVMRVYLCQMLRAIKPGAPMAAAAPIAAYPSSSGSGRAPAPFTPAKTQAFCLSNGSFYVDAVDDAHAPYRTWTLYDDGDGAQTALARVKSKLAGMGGMRVTSERYFGRQGTLEIMADAPGKLLKQGSPGLPIRLDIDDAMGTISVAAAPHGDQWIEGSQMRFAMCSLVAAATRTAMPPAVAPEGVPAKRALFTNPFKKSDPMAEAKAKGQLGAEAFALVRARAIYAGKAIVIMPVLDMDTKYQTIDVHDIQVKFLAQYFDDRSGAVVWRARNRPGDEFTAGPRRGQAMIGLRGYFDDFTIGKSRFAVYYLDPGTYDLSAASIERRGAALPQSAGKHASRSPIGSYVATRTMERGFTATKEWREATHETRSTEQSACVMEEAASGRCVQSENYRQQYNVQTSEAGWVNVIHEAPLASVDVTTDLAKPFASFDVAPGEVVVVDGFAVDAESAKADAATCEVSGDTARCSLGEFSLWRIPVTAGDAQRIVSVIRAGEPMRAVIGAAKVRPVTINATALPELTDAGFWETGWARRYVMRAR
jgi:hypothetical protein